MTYNNRLREGVFACNALGWLIKDHCATTYIFVSGAIYRSPKVSF